MSKQAKEQKENNKPVAAEANNFMLRIRVVDSFTGLFSEVLKAQHESIPKLKAIAANFVESRAHIHWVCLNTFTGLAKKLTHLGGNHVTLGIVEFDPRLEISIVSYLQFQQWADGDKAIQDVSL